VDEPVKHVLGSRVILSLNKKFLLPNCDFSREYGLYS